MDQPDGRAPGTPGGDAATEALIAQLEARGLAPPQSGRTQAFAMSTRRTSGKGVLTWGGRRRVAGDGWDAVPGSWALESWVAFPFDAPFESRDISVGSLVPVWRVTGEPVADAGIAQITIETSLHLWLSGEEATIVLEPAIVTGRNVMAWVPGRGALAEEVVIVGGHRDHLAPVGGHVFPGADDNASGVAATVCALQAFAEEDPLGDRRAVLGVWFDGEEDGMWGSAAYVADPAVPLASTAAVVVLDMVGRLRDETLTVGGTAAEAWRAWLAPDTTLTLATDASPSNSDDIMFGALGLRAVHLFTGKHEDYHMPTDTADRLDLGGIARITELTAGALGRLTTSASLPAPGPATDPGLRVGGVDGHGRPVVGAVVPYSVAALDGWQPGDAAVYAKDFGFHVEPCIWQYSWERIARAPVPEP